MNAVGSVDLHAIAKDAAERVHKNGGCVPQLAFAPILWALQDALRSGDKAEGGSLPAASQPSVPTECGDKAVLAMLESARSMMRIVSDGFADEGDRVYLGSTNHADWLRDEAERVEAFLIGLWTAPTTAGEPGQ